MGAPRSLWGKPEKPVSAQSFLPCGRCSRLGALSAQPARDRHLWVSYIAVAFSPWHLGIGHLDAMFRILKPRL